MAGHDKPRLSDDEMRHALQHPIGSPRLSELARDKEQVCIIFSGVNGYLDNIEVAQVRGFEDGLLTILRSENQDLLDTIRDEGALSDESSEKLTAVLEKFSKNYA